MYIVDNFLDLSQPNVHVHVPEQPGEHVDQALRPPFPSYTCNQLLNLSTMTP